MPAVPNLEIVIEPFLPQLEKLYCFVTCLGEWSRLFELPRPALTEVAFHCAHFADSTGSPVNFWHELPNIWPNLVDLSVYSSCPNLTIKILSQIVPQMKKLEGLWLPSNLKETAAEKQEIQNLKTELEKRNILFFFSDVLSQCSLLPQLDDHLNNGEGDEEIHPENDEFEDDDYEI